MKESLINVHELVEDRLFSGGFVELLEETRREMSRPDDQLELRFRSSLAEICPVRTMLLRSKAPRRTTKPGQPAESGALKTNDAKGNTEVGGPAVSNVTKTNVAIKVDTKMAGSDKPTLLRAKQMAKTLTPTLISPLPYQTFGADLPHADSSTCGYRPPPPPLLSFPGWSRSYLKNLRLLRCIRT